MSIGEEELVFLPGFAWALPEAFAAAVAAYRFEQGDVLHRERRGYAPLGHPWPKDLTTIQLRRPPRSARTLPTEADGDRRLASWQSEVELDLIEVDAGRVRSLETTQGRLFMALWRGDLGWLDGERDDPALPRSARELAQWLREGPLSLPSDGLRGGRFVFVVDLASDAARIKASAVVDALRPLGACEVRDHRPGDVGVPEADRFQPTLVLREVRVADGNLARMESALKPVLYGGKGESERFLIARHGLLEASPIAAAD